MTVRFDLDDIPAATLPEMWLVMRIAIDHARGLVFLRGATKDDVRTIETAFWKAYRGDAARGTAILLRFWRLADAFSSRRLRARLMQDGYAALAPALAAAGSLRLNASWGFAPQRILWAMAAYEETAETSVARDSFVTIQTALAA